MKSELDQLMQAAGLDGMWITGSPEISPEARYFVGRAHLSHVSIFLKVGQPARLIHSPMEADEAALTGMRTTELDLSEWQQELTDAKGDRVIAQAAMAASQFEHEQLTGRVAVYGQMAIGKAYRLVTELEQRLPQVALVLPDGDQDVLTLARKTKDSDEVEAIRKIGMTTVEVVQLTRDLLGSSPVESGILLDSDGAPLTIGEVKRQIHLWLAERGAESPTGPILAQGRDGAIGHSVGIDSDPIRVSSPIVFDLYPRQRGGGYYFDFTRTWCIDDVMPEVRSIYDHVKHVYDQVLPKLVAGASTRALENEVCDQFESLGHTTLRLDSQTKDGYIHSVAHGVGLDIHEAPIFGFYKDSDDTLLAPGMVVTFEPGLYYPEQEMGVRLEDAVLIMEEGPPQVLVPYSHDLLLSRAAAPETN